VTHRHGTVSVSGSVDPEGCCAAQPDRLRAAPTAATFLAELRATADKATARRLAELLWRHE